LTADSGTSPKQTSSGTVEARPVADDASSAVRAQLAPGKTAETPKSEVWLRRASVLLFVTLSAVVGVLLVLLPWSLQWTANRWLWSYPEVRTTMANGFVRGVCSGLGMLTLWVGFREAVNYHEGTGAVK
jgi:hypothetical protein